MYTIEQIKDVLRKTVGDYDADSLSPTWFCIDCNYSIGHQLVYCKRCGQKLKQYPDMLLATYFGKYRPNDPGGAGIYFHYFAPPFDAKTYDYGKDHAEMVKFVEFIGGYNAFRKLCGEVIKEEMAKITPEPF
jgi:hypothetical protein